MELLHSTNLQAMVHDFHQKFGLEIHTTPVDIDPATVAFRMNLIYEEAHELFEAFRYKDIASVAKELADLLYVVYGTAVTCGIDLNAVFSAVHESNMTKNGGGTRADGKILKGPDYREPDIGAVLYPHE